MERIKLKKINNCQLEDKPDLITHSGNFHADDVFSTVVLSFLLDKEEIKLCRVNDIKDNGDYLIYDIGGGKYDHHQQGGNGKRDNGISYASFGLIWKDYGISFLEKLKVENKEEMWDAVDKKLVQLVDSMDNGQLKNNNQFNIDILSVPKLISLYNSNWDEDSNQDIKFIEAVEFATLIFNKLLDSLESKIKAKDIVKEKIALSNDKILVLDKYMPWKEAILEINSDKAKEILYVITPSNREGYTISAVPKEIGSFELRKPFPESWAGLKNEELAKVSGIKTANFCHNNRFLCVTNTKEDAIKLAKKALEM